MGIGERLKMARQMAGMSQRALAEASDVSAMAVSKYERDLMTPGSEVLLRLGLALGVKAGFFLRPVTASLTTPSFRRKASLGAPAQEAILARTQAWLERYLDVESLVAGAPVYMPPAIDRRVTTLTTPNRWPMRCEGMGSGARSDREPRRGAGGPRDQGRADRRCGRVRRPDPMGKRARARDGCESRDGRRSAAAEPAHELGHLVLEPADGVDEEKAAFRFAGAFLVPRSMAIYELGERRTELDLVELHMLKHKYGVSVQAWVYRARDLRIISEATATELWKLFRARRWRERAGRTRSRRRCRGGWNAWCCGRWPSA